MKMYIEPLPKEAIERYLKIPDLTQGNEPHAVKLLYDRVGEHMRRTHPDSEVMVIREPPIVDVADNYDNLLIPHDNISRSSVYTHYVDETHILRTHTTAHIPSIMRGLAGRNDWEDVLVLLPGLAYRRDVTDKIHLGEIHMLEMWRISRGRKIVKQDLLNMMASLAEVAAPGWSLRIIDSPHPYTQGGIEVNAVQGERDIEIGEAGLISDELLANSGLDPSNHSGWASGMGLDRLVMTLKGIPDIRYLRSTNSDIARQMTDLAPYQEVSNQPSIRRDMSYSVPQRYVEEDINEEIRQAMGDQAGVLESVEVLSETDYKDLPLPIRERLGIDPRQKNVLVRVTLRHLERSLTNEEANQLYQQVYAQINHGKGGYL